MHLHKAPPPPPGPLLQVSLIVVDQEGNKHLVQTFKPNSSSSSFQQPRGDMNVASGCPQFCALSVLADASYVKDDVMFIKAIVDTTEESQPSYLNEATDEPWNGFHAFRHLP